VSISHRLDALCPACGTQLFIELGITVDQIVCRNVNCKRPTAAHEILSETEIGHIVMLGERDFSMKHPLVERIRDELLKCDFMLYMRSLLRTPLAPGKYRVVHSSDAGPVATNFIGIIDGWQWESLE